MEERFESGPAGLRSTSLVSPGAPPFTWAHTTGGVMGLHGYLRLLGIG